MRKNKLLYDKFGAFRDEWKVLISLFVFLCIWNLSAICFSEFREGLPRTFSGKVVYIEQKHNKWQNFDYTVIQILTTLDDKETILFWGYIDLQPNVVYKIYAIRHIERCPQFPWWMNQKWKVIRIEVINIV